MNKASAFNMNALDSRIKELIAYARERDGEDRTVLFRNLVDLFLTGKAPQKSPTRNQLLDVLEALVPHVETDSRRTVAELVANMSAPPVDLALRLCRDRASLVAGLLKKVSFDEDDIIELISRTGREHHQILASREDLSANVWIALARAAPSAPPFDNQSTLALWSDDLGIMRTGTHDGVAASSVPKSATVTPFRSGKKANGKPSIRIIKTDEDLMAERRPEIEPEASSDTGNETPNTDLQPDKQASTKPNRAPENTLSPVLQQFVDAEFANKQLNDPGPGGWAWQSDRDGLITNISPHGNKLIGRDMQNANASILDLLGLNQKLGHPVARAFQRRSTIHDAPIYLAELEKPHQHWTLEATPFFSSGGGIFEGYEGVLTPVVPRDKNQQSLRSEEEATALFLDEVTQLNIPEIPAVKPAIKPVTTKINAPATQIKTPVAPVAPVPQSKPMRKAQQQQPTANPIANAAALAVKDVISEALGPIAKALTGETKLAPKAPIKAASTNVETAEILATLDLLEEALSRLTKAGKSSGETHMRLQTEIAAACARTLRDQLTK